MSYEIRIKGHLEHEWTAWFGDLTITPEEDGDTLITGPVIDQAALYGVLKKIRDLGLPLISVNPVRPDRTNRSMNEPSNPASMGSKKITSKE